MERNVSEERRSFIEKLCAFIPTGVYALNKLGLSTQVPANIIYITDGSARQVKFGEGKSITFRHSNDLGNFAYQSKLMQLAVLSMREIGEKLITEEQVAQIKNMITENVSEQDFNHDIFLIGFGCSKVLNTRLICNLVTTEYIELRLKM